MNTAVRRQGGEELRETRALSVCCVANKGGEITSSIASTYDIKVTCFTRHTSGNEQMHGLAE